MIRSELVQRIAAQNPHLHPRDVELLVGAMLDEIREALSRRDRAEVRGFGTFSSKRRKARIARNPQTGAVINISSKIVPAFRAGKEMRSRLNPSYLFNEASMATE